MINKFKYKLKQFLSSQFVRNVSWLGTAELANRIFRLATTVTLARTFSPQDYGLMAIIYTTIDFANVFTLKGGIGGKIIQADEQDVKNICNTSYWLNWILCSTIFCIQCIVAYIVTKFYQNNQILLPILTISCVYLFLPIYMVQSAMIERENRLKVIAIGNVAYSLFSNAIIVTFAIFHMGIWAIVWGTLLATPIWIIVAYVNHSWRPPKHFTLKDWRKIINYGGNVLGIELIGMMKWNLDYIIVGNYLGIEALGIYFFAFNAGLGIGLNVLGTFTSALFPYLCEARDEIQLLQRRFFSSLKKTSAILIPLIIIQSSLAPFYIPIIFGQKWINAIPVVVLLCLSALPFSLSRSTYVLLNAVDKTRLNFYLQLVYTIIFAVSLLIAINWGIYWVAASVLISNLLTLVIGSIWTIKYVFRLSNYR